MKRSKSSRRMPERSQPPSRPHSGKYRAGARSGSVPAHLLRNPEKRRSRLQPQDRVPKPDPSPQRPLPRTRKRKKRTRRKIRPESPHPKNRHPKDPFREIPARRTGKFPLRCLGRRKVMAKRAKETMPIMRAKSRRQKRKKAAGSHITRPMLYPFRQTGRSSTTRRMNVKSMTAPLPTSSAFWIGLRRKPLSKNWKTNACGN